MKYLLVLLILSPKVYCQDFVDCSTIDSLFLKYETTYALNKANDNIIASLDNNLIVYTNKAGVSEAFLVENFISQVNCEGHPEDDYITIQELLDIKQGKIRCNNKRKIFIDGYEVHTDNLSLNNLFVVIHEQDKCCLYKVNWLNSISD